DRARAAAAAERGHQPDQVALLAEVEDDAGAGGVGAAPGLHDADAGAADVAGGEDRLTVAEGEGGEDPGGAVDGQGAVPDAPVHAELAVELHATAGRAGGAGGAADAPAGGVAVGDAVGRDAPGPLAD